MRDPSVEPTLRRVLGETYAIERELTAGGMSRVFLARELALDRLVVLKVLPESLATTLSADRFRREIALLAKLQHPNIVPLLAAGQAAGMLWYAMPFVEGESLGDRLRREGALPVPIAVALLRDAARALAYAHSKGVVHRDIKPDNLLLAGDALQVADFGVARALVNASTTDAGAKTTAGMAVGTPRYMSPEQVAADPAMDHRADLYSLGAVAFELFSGRPPYEAPSPIQLMRLHATAPVPSMAKVPGVTPALDALVQQLLAKSPSARPTSASEVVTRLETVTGDQPAVVRRSRPSRRMLLTAGVAVLALAGGVAWRAGVFGPRSLIAAGKLQAEASVLLAEFTNTTTDSLLATTLQTALRVDLAQVASVRLVSVDRVRTELRLMKQSPDAPLSPALAREVAERLGAGALVDGSVAPLGTGFLLVGRIVTREGEELATERETAASSDQLIAATGRLGAALRRRLGESMARVRAAPALSRATTASLPALRAYTRAVAFSRQGRNTESLAAADDAIAADSGFAMAWNARATALINLRARTPEMQEAQRRAYALRESLTEPERLTVEAAYASRVLRDESRSLPIWLRLAELAPDRSAPRNNAALNLVGLGRPAEALALLRAAIGIDSQSTAAWVNLGSVYFMLGDSAASDSLPAQLDRRFPGRGFGTLERLTLAQERRDYATARTLFAAIRAGKDSVPDSSEPLARESAMEATLGHARRARELVQEVRRRFGADAAEAAERSAALLSARTQGVWLRDTAGARRELNALAASPLARSGDPEQWPLADVAYEFALLGDVARGRALLREQEAAVLRVARSADDSLRWQRSREKLLADGMLLLFAGQPAQAAERFEQRRARTNPSRVLLELALVQERLQQPDSALALLTRYESRPDPDRAWEDPFDLAFVRWRAAELAEQLGRRDVAIRWWSAFVDQWRTADPTLQPRVQEAKRRLAVLTGEPRS